MAAMCAKSKNPTCEAWQLLVRFSFTQRATLPALAAELELSPAQCHLLTVIERIGVPMGESECAPVTPQRDGTRRSLESRGCSSAVHRRRIGG
jgi:hypothetical protein